LHRSLAVLTSLALLLSLAGTTIAAKPISDVSPRPDDVNYNNGVALPFNRADIKNANPPLGPGKIGDTKTWLGLDDYRGVINLKNYTLRGVGTNVEVWVSTNLNFPNPDMKNPLTTNPNDFFTYNDCRNDGVRNVITDDQVDYLIEQFDTVMYPIESEWWSTPPNRMGNKATLAKQLGSPQSYYRGEGDNVVVLVDNVRDSNFYDPNNATSQSYIAGFYYSVFDNYFDRTVMSIDAWDWLHRTGADPAHFPTTNPCTSAPARPYLYEGVFAHEYQHLLHHYTDPDEPSWVNEGLSDFTEVITGYADLARHVDEKGHESHTQSYLGWKQVFEANWNPLPYAAGPENGLTAWEDQGPGEILADYGFAMFFMNFVYNQGWGQDFFRAWQHNQDNGIAGLNSTLAAFGSGATFESLFNDQIISALVDGYIDNGASVSGGSAAQFQNGTAGQALAPEATILLNAQANSTAGAPPWGADYVDLGSGAGLSSVVFDGADNITFTGGPDWVVDGDGYWTNPDVSGQFYYDNNQDLSIARPITVTGAGNLTFEHYYGMELGWDFGFVQVSDDNGDTWTSQPCSGTTPTADPSAFPYITAHLPGYTGPTGNDKVPDTTGSAGAPIAASCDLSAYSGAGPILLAFRLMVDELYEQDGWHIKNLVLDGVAVDASPADLSDWNNVRYYSPLDLDFGFALVGINGTVDGYGDVTAGTSVKVFRPTLGAGSDYTLSGADLVALSTYAKVVAVVWGIPATEDVDTYQPYSLLVDFGAGDVEKADGA
ncbi:MAG: hypothetical protein ABIQ05_01325, partial [Candidatus Limnocylindria bacterium]